MFGMLDYRAHKLYKLLFFIPNFAIWLFTIFVYPFVSYAIGFKFSDRIIWQILLSVIAFFILGIVWTIIVKIYAYMTNEIFTLFVDIVPADGRDEEEAKAVVLGGKPFIDLLNYSKNIRLSDDAMIERIAGYGFFSIFFAEKVKERLSALRDYYLDRTDLMPSEWQSQKALDELGLAMSGLEKVLTNAYIRNVALQTLMFLLILIYHPNL